MNVLLGSQAFRNLLEEGTNPKDSEIKQALPLRTMGIGFRRQKIINLSDEIKKKMQSKQQTITQSN